MTVEGSPDVDHYYAHDHLFSVVALIADDGSIEERYVYDAYGKMTRLDPDFSSWSGTPVGNPYYFTGQRLDNLDSGSLLIMYYKNRYYLVDIGRFIQRDPLGIRDGICIIEFAPTGKPTFPRKHNSQSQYRDGMSLYEYVKSNPVKNIDAMGLDIWSFVDCFNDCLKDNDPLSLCAKAIPAIGSISIKKKWRLPGQEPRTYWLTKCCGKPWIGRLLGRASTSTVFHKYLDYIKF